MVTPIFTGGTNTEYKVTKVEHGYRYPKFNPEINYIDITSSAHNIGTSDILYKRDVAIWHILPYSKDVAKIMVAESYLPSDFLKDLQDEFGNHVNYNESVFNELLSVTVPEIPIGEEDHQNVTGNFEYSNSPIDQTLMAISRKLMDLIMESCFAEQRLRGDMASLILANFEILGLTEAAFWLSKYIHSVILDDYDDDDNSLSSYSALALDFKSEKGPKKDPKFLLTELTPLFLECLQVTEQLLDYMFKMCIISKHSKDKILCQPNRIEKVSAFMADIKALGCTATSVLIESLKHTNQNTLAALVSSKFN